MSSTSSKGAQPRCFEANSNAIRIIIYYIKSKGWVDGAASTKSKIALGVLGVELAEVEQTRLDGVHKSTKGYT